tara:strand:+ start:1143 stop:1553 length:411 start_codon:yes stop_codon:yes gene_type:complete
MFFKKKENDMNGNFIKVAALLIHAAKIDQDYSENEEKIIIQALLEFGIDQNNIQQIISEGKKIESNSNQILEFTKEVKKMNNDNKIKIVETLWRIIYSNKEADVYEASLMRRLAGLLYIDSKVMGDIKKKIIKEIE